MRVVFVALFFLLVQPQSRAQTTFDPDAVEEVSCREAFSYSSARTAEDAAVLLFAPTQGYDLKCVNAGWQIDMITGAIEGRIMYRFTALQTLDTFFLDAVDSLHITAAYHQGVAVAASHADNVVGIVLTQPVPAGQTDSVVVEYNGLPQPGGLGGYMRSSHNGDSIVSTLSEPYGSRDWWPSKVSLSDKIDSLNIDVRVPLGNRVAANGLLVKIDTFGTTVAYHWRSRYPIATYLIGVSAYPYAEVTHRLPLGNDTLFMQHDAYPDHVSDIVDYQPTLDSVFRMYTEWFGPYPFIREKYGHAQWNRGGGMEHQTMSFVSDFGHELVAHELAHQWFGDKITCGSWSDIWLNEGWATYAASLTFQQLANGVWWMPSVATNNKRALKDSVSSVYCDDTTDVDRIFDSRLSYSKGACLLHSLRYLMKDSAFFSGVREYLSDTALAYGFSRTANFKHHLENHYGNLDEFFSDWYYGKGNPRLHLYWSQRGEKLNCTLTQTSFAHPNDGFVFDMKVPVTFYGANRDTTFDLDNHSAFDSYEFNVPFNVDSVKIDPNLWWLIGEKLVTALDSLSEEGNIHAFPNPVSDNLTLVSDVAGDTTQGDAIQKVEIFSVDGKLIFVQKNFNAEALQPVSIDASAFATGIYFVRVSGSLSTTVIRVVKSGSRLQTNEFR